MFLCSNQKALRGISGTWALRGHSKSTRALKALKYLVHSGTWLLRALETLYLANPSKHDTEGYTMMYYS